MPRIETYQNGILISVSDDRTVSTTSSARIAAIKTTCAESIEATGIGWMVQREVSGGAPVPQSVKDQCAALRAKSNALEAQILIIAASAASDDDKTACDTIEGISW